MNHDPSSKTSMPTVEYLSMRAENEEIDLLELWQAIWQRKRMISLIATVFTAIAVGVALILPNIYTSTATLAPSEEQQGGGLSALAGQFGGLASLAGVSLGNGKADKTTVAVEIANSRQFMTRFVREHQLEVALMAATGMDKKTKALVIDDDLFDVKTQRWVRKVKEGQSIEPTDWELYKVISKIIAVTQDKKSGFVTISIDYYSPEMAKQWVDWFVTDLNNYMRKRDQIDSKRNITYLKQQLEKTAVADMQTVFYQLIEQQTKTLMLSEVNTEYVFKTLDPAVIAEEKTKPKRALIVILGGVVGGMFGVLFALIQHATARRRARALAQ
jgi:LPS O-antigen subunit length determinant protein (WzzB/FepE family)